MAVSPLGRVDVASLVGTTVKRPKLLFFVTEDWVFCSHRLALGQAAVNAGYEVVLVTRLREHKKLIEDAGIRVIPIEHQRGGLNLFSDFRVLLHLWSIYRIEGPSLVHHVALKPVLLGSLVAALAGIPQVNAITGLGWIFISQSTTAKFLSMVLTGLLRLTLRRGISILQNPEDQNWIINLGIPLSSTRLIRGAGVNIEKFAPTFKELTEPTTVMLVARMLFDKGVLEFVDAAKQLKTRGVNGRFVLVGAPDQANRASVTLTQLECWQAEGVVEWWGYRDDISICYSQAHIACLPSYREGLPKSLLEAAASGLPIVTTDTPGCREVVCDGENGLLVPVKSSQALADALERLLIDPVLRDRMGKRSREIAENEFDVERVIAKTLEVYRELSA